MLIGLGNKKTAAPAQDAAPDDDVIFNVGTTDFEARVLALSMDKPVLVDFWAPWCGPCKQLMPTLEGVVREAKGKIALAKVNIDDNPELAQALRVQSVPTVFAFFQGQPVTGFNGVRPQSELKMLIEQLLKMAQQMQPDAIDIPAALKQAGEALVTGDTALAQNLYVTILAQDENNAPAYSGLIRVLVASGAYDDAQEMIDNAPEAIAKSHEFAAARTALEMAKGGPAQAEIAGFQARLAKDAGDHDARFNLALALFGAGRADAAIDELLAIMKADRAWEEDKARLQILKIFEALGPMDPAVAAGRRKLSALLFS